jgi:hypothetical protein
MRNKFAISKIFLLLSFLMAWGAADGAQNAPNVDQIRVFGISVGGSKTIEDVMNHLGAARILRFGDASEAEERICYRVRDEKGRENTLFFASIQGMALPSRQVNSIRLIKSNSNLAQKKNCGVLHLRRLNGLGPIHLGMSREEIRRTRGPDISTSDDSMIYSMCTRKYLAGSDPLFARWIGRAECFDDPKRPYLDDCRTMKIDFKKGHAVSIGINRNQGAC